VRFDTDGNVTHNLQSASGEVGMTTSVNRHEDGLYVGGLFAPYVVRVPLSEID